ncbi:MAG: helix-turn-helix domain-containing protein [Acidobacteria bacterium]|nr:helix-turn-helix domain-containing protein [Acidobacteriota bacterium]
MQLLRRRQQASAESIAHELGVTPNAVRQHLANLEREGFVRSEPERHARGRPVLLFSLTDLADEYFPKRYGQLASMVLAEVQEMHGSQELDEIFRRLARRYAPSLRDEVNGLPFEDQVAKVVDAVGRAGTLAVQSEVPGGIEISLHNCPFRSAAERFPQICSITPNLFSEVIGTEVSPARSIHKGDPYCSYVVHRPDPDAD